MSGSGLPTLEAAKRAHSAWRARCLAARCATEADIEAAIRLRSWCASRAGEWQRIDWAIEPLVPNPTAAGEQAPDTAVYWHGARLAATAAASASPSLPPPSPPSLPPPSTVVAQKPHSRLQPPDPMPPELAAAGFEAAVWADTRRFPKPARKAVRRLFKVATSEEDVALAVAHALRLAAGASQHLARRGPGQQPNQRPSSRTASFGDARRVSVTIEGPRSSSRHFDLALSAGCVELYRAAAAAFAVLPRSFRLLRRGVGGWRTVVDDADLRTALQQAMQLQPPQISLRKESSGEPEW